MIYALFYVPIFLHALASMFASKFRKLREAEILFENTLRRAEESVKNIIK
jgi:hypothetical protein